MRVTEKKYAVLIPHSFKPESYAIVENFDTLKQSLEYAEEIDIIGTKVIRHEGDEIELLWERGKPFVKPEPKY